MSDDREEPGVPDRGTGAAWAVGAAGAFVLLLAADIVPQSAFEPNVPSWVLAMIGLLLLSGAAAVFVGLGTAASARWVAVAMFLMGLTFLWIAVFGEARYMSGGIPFLPQWLNVAVFRGVFALASLGFFAVALSAWRWARRKAQED